MVPSHPRRLPGPKVFSRNYSEEWWMLWTWILFIWELRKDVFSGTPGAKREVLQCLHPGSRSTNVSRHRLHWGAWREVTHTFMLSYTLQETRQSFLWKNQQIFFLRWCLRPIEWVVRNSVGMDNVEDWTVMDGFVEQQTRHNHLWPKSMMCAARGGAGDRRSPLEIPVYEMSWP